LLRWIPIRLLPIPLQLARINLLHKPDANLPQLFVLRIGAELLFRGGQILSERLDLQIAQLAAQLEMIARRPQALLDDLTGLVDASGAAVETGQLQITMNVARVRLDSRQQR